MRPVHFFLLLFCFILSPQLFAGAIKISDVTAVRDSPTQHFVRANLHNTSDQMMETVVRSELAFYDRNSPEGDLPVHVLKKDQSFILKPQETLPLEAKFLEEGAPPSIPLRIEPLVRIRREREWKY